MENSSTEIFPYENNLLQRLKFSLLLTFHIPAYTLTLLTFIFFNKNRRVLRAPQNPALLILLLVNFIQLSVTSPLDLRFYFLGYVTPSTPTFCTWWTFIEFTLYVVSEYLMATISIQRHMLIFNAHVLRIRWMRIAFHHLPLLFCVIYPLVFYFFAVILYPCDGTQYDYSHNICGLAPCYLLFNKILGTFDWSVNNGLPMVANALANLLLIVRVIRQKLHQNQPVSWRKQRRMTIQLFCLSSLYLLAWSPSLIVGLVQILGFPTFLAQIQIDYLLDLIYIVSFFLPWVCLGLIPELLAWIKVLGHLGKPRNRVTNITHMTHGHPITDH